MLADFYVPSLSNYMKTSFRKIIYGSNFVQTLSLLEGSKNDVFGESTEQVERTRLDFFYFIFPIFVISKTRSNSGDHDHPFQQK